jgi:IclR helix-turn-helix domain
MTHPARRQQASTDLVPVDAVDGRDLALYDDLTPEEKDILDGARTRRVPWMMAGVTAGVGVSAWGCAQVAGAMAGPDGAATVETVTWMATAVSVPLLRSMFRHRIADVWRKRWWLSTAAAAAWVDVVAAQGPNLVTAEGATGAGVALLLGTVGFGGAWWRAHEVPNPGDVDELDDQPEPEPVPLAPAPRRPEIDTSRAREIEADWAARVADGANPIAKGSELQHRTHLPHGYRWLIQLDRDGSKGATALITDATEAGIALKLGVRATHVMVERLEGDDDREDRALLTVVTRDVLADGVKYRGPNYDRGVIRIGRYADGTGDARWTSYDRTGVLCGLVTGEQRSGKSAFMALLGMAYRASGEWLVLFGDGDPAGGSSPVLAQIAHDFAKGPQEVLQQLEGLEAILEYARGDLMGLLTLGPTGTAVPITRPGQRPLDKMLPCPRFPGIAWILDEMHKLTEHPDLRAVGFAKRVGKVVRGLAKYGVALIVGTQSSLGTDFGGDSALRAMLAKNQLTMRTLNKSETGVVGNGSFNPGSLPKGGGYGFLGDGERQAMIRTEHDEDMDEYAPEVMAAGVDPDALEEPSWAVYRRYRVVRVLDREVDYEERTARLAKVRTALATGAHLPGSPEEKAAQEEAAKAAKDAEGQATGQALIGSEVGQRPMSFGGFTIPTGASNVVPIRPSSAPKPAATPARLSDKALRVLAILRTHTNPWTTAQVEYATKLPKPDVSKALGELVKAGLAERVSWGVYSATTISVQKQSS